MRTVQDMESKIDETAELIDEDEIDCDDDPLVASEALLQALEEVASSIVDTLPPKKRNEKIQNLKDDCTNYSLCRQALSTWKGKCTSQHAFRRVAGLFNISIGQSNDIDTNKSLCKGLCNLIHESGDVDLLESCVAALSSGTLSKEMIGNVFYQLASDSKLLQSESTIVIPAITMGQALVNGSSTSLDNADDWCNILLQYSLLRFSNSSDLDLARPFFLTKITNTQWTTLVGPALQQKLKSHPDKTLETLLGWMQHIQIGVAEIDDEWIALLMKHLTSVKDNNPQVSSKILLTWSKQTVSSAEKIVIALSNAKPALAPARVSVYETLTSIATLCDGQGDFKMETKILQQVIQSLLDNIKKEPKAEHRAASLQALVEWLIVAKREKEHVAAYSQALDEVVRKPLLAKKLPEAGIMLSLLVKSVHPDLLGPMATDMWRWNTEVEKKTWSKALEAAIDSASTKKSVQGEGILVLYFALLQADHSSLAVPAYVSKILSAGATKKENPSFLYSQSVIDTLAKNEIVGVTIPRVLALYAKVEATTSSSSSLVPKGKQTAAARLIAQCCMHPSAYLSKLQYASNTVTSSLQTILLHEPSAAEGLVHSLFDQVNCSALQFESLVRSINDSRDARENDDKEFPMKGQGSDYSIHSGCDLDSVRRTARLLSKYTLADTKSLGTIVRLLVLMHAGTSLKSDGHQRAALILHVTSIVRDLILPICDDHNTLGEMVAQEIVGLGSSFEIIDTNSKSEDSSSQKRISDSIQRATMSLIVTFGGMASNYQSNVDDENVEDIKPSLFANVLCTISVPKLLSTKLETTLGAIEDLSPRDVEIYLYPMGVLVGSDQVTNDSTKISKKVNGKYLTEDEEWELQMKKELEEKKKKAMSPEATSVLSEDAKNLLLEQDHSRQRMDALLNGQFIRCLDCIKCLCFSDIEVGNSCLPALSNCVIRATVSISPALTSIRTLKEKCFDTLTALASCVYEVSEGHAPTIATALTISCRQSPVSATSTTSLELHVSPLPSPCAPAACVIYQIDLLSDTILGSSFTFLFPVIRACLMGIRTPVGCEGALRVLYRHTALLAEERYDAHIAKLRKDMIVAVLDLLKHDRAMSFHDPTPFEALIGCFQSSESTSGHPFTTGELAPLLDERGALGSPNCRIAAMQAIGFIAEKHRKFVKLNPLIETRVWLNCFEKDESIMSNARRTWFIIHDIQNVSEVSDVSLLPKPSPLYAAPLLPLLHHSDSQIATSAATAYAHAMGMYPSTVGRNIEILCKTYIDSFPMTDSDSSSAQSSVAKPIIASLAVPVKKKVVATGLPKKVSAPPKSALAVAGIGKQKVIKKKTSNSALLQPKQERTLDPDEIASMFKNTVVVTKVSEEKDSQLKTTIRMGVLRTISELSVSKINLTMDETTLKLLTSFLMAYGIADANSEVKNAARNALSDIVASNGGTEEAIAFLLPHLETVLKTGVADESSLSTLQKDKVPKDVSATDRRKEGAVVALGSVALHLQGPENESKVDSTVDMLISALKTPSEEVQQSVADVLTKLVKKGKTMDRVKELLSVLLNDCLHADALATRRGAAYGLSAVVKGCGIATLKKYEIVKQLEEACSSGSAVGKEGSLFSIELLSSRLGLLFEPYVIVLLPSLLKAFSDGSDHVRAAANDTAGLIMSKLSAHGVKLVLPAVLAAFNDPAWRTKQASIRMLGAMSHLAPKQLASALPKVVPKLTEAFSDTHTKVKITAQDALHEISSVIKNPEVSSISTILLKALTDPADYTIKALEALIETEFLHAIDAPSLALIVPILHRGLRDRGAATKRYGGLIAGNICTMINDPKDFVPYLPTLLPDIQTALLDPIPDVRSTSAKALGSLTRSLGDQVLPELRPWLIRKLREEACSSAERSGAAQGLTEVLIASGSEVVEETMRNEILPLQSYPDTATREGVLWMLTFLPPALGQGFTPLIDSSLPALISGLSDDSEPVREVAMRAGRVLIRSHGKIHVNKILPSLETGLSDDDHRIRVASLSLLGDLLSMIGGTQVLKGDGNTQDDIRKAERAQAQIAIVLGAETRKRVLSGLYLARCDTVHIVRQSAIQVWKTVVSVTARTLKDILPILVARIIEDLASGNDEKTDVAGRCLGELVRRLGDSVLPQIIPVLRNSLYQGNEHTKRGVCVGLMEVINCSTKEQILKFIEIIIKVLQDALSDDNESVRRMAATSFQSLHSVVGNRALEEVVPSLMVALENKDADESSRLRALNGLTGILSIRSRELLPYIIPRLISKPITTSHANALAGICEVTSGTIHYHFSTIIPSILSELSSTDSPDERSEAILKCANSICRNVGTSGLSTLISEIASKCNSDKPALRKASCLMFELVATNRADKEDVHDHVPIMIRELTYRLNDENELVLKATNKALFSMASHIPAQELVKHVEFMRNLLASMVSDARRRKGGVGDGEFLLPGFNIPKGVEPLIPIFQQGILYGNPNIREVSAAGLGEVIALTDSKYLAGPIIIKMTGPLLRIVGDRNPSTVKIAILKTLGLLLEKGGPALRAFVPQFQTTFVKALSDPSRQVRVAAILSLSLLMPLTTRVDPLVKELVSGSMGKNGVVEGVSVTAVQTASLDALATVLEIGGIKVKLPGSIVSALDCAKELLSCPDTGIRESAAKVMGVCCALLGPDETNEIVKLEVMSRSGQDATSKHAALCAIRRILASDVGLKLDENLLREMKSIIITNLQADKEVVRIAACVALGTSMGRLNEPRNPVRKTESELLKIMNNSRETIDIHRAVARGICIALLMIDREKRIEFMGLPLMDSCLSLSLNSSQRVQIAFQDVLWLALDVENGQNGLDKYCSKTIFDNQRSVKSIHSKILLRMKGLSIMDN